MTRIVLTAEDRASAVIGQAQKNLQSLAATMGGMPALAAGFSVGAVATGLIALTKSSIDYMASLHDMSIATGASVESLSAMKTAAKLANVDMETVAGSIKKLAISLGDAKLKGGDKAKLFEALGIDPKTVSDTGAAMFDLAKKLDAMPDKMKAISIARDLLGKNVSLPFINELAQQEALIAKVTADQAAAADRFNDNMVRMKSGAGQLGIALANSALPAMNDILSFSLEIKKEWGSLAAIIFGLGGGAILKGLGVELDPLKRAAKETTEALNELIAARKRLATETDARANAGSQLGPLGNWVRDKLHGDTSGKDVAAARSRLRASLAEQARLDKEKIAADYAEYRRKKGGSDVPDGALASGTKKDDYTPLMRSIAEKNANLAAEAESTTRLTAAQQFALKVMTDIQGGYVELTAAQKAALAGKLEEMLANDKLNQSTEARRKALELEAKALDEYFKEEEKGRLLVEDFIRGTRVMQERAEQTLSMIGLREREKQVIEATRKIEDEAAEARRRAFRDIKDPELYQQAVEGINDALETQKKKLADTTAAVYDYSTSWEAGTKTAMASYLDEVDNMASQSAKLVTDSFRGMEDALVEFVKTGKLDFSSLADSIISDLIRIQVQQTITKPLAESISNGGILSGIGDFISGAFGGGRASGGPVDPGKFYVVGERGPEVLIPNSAGTVIPNGALSPQPAQVTAQPVNINFNVSAMDAGSFRSSMAANRNVIVGIVREAFTRRAITSPV